MNPLPACVLRLAVFFAVLALSLGCSPPLGYESRTLRSFYYEESASIALVRIKAEVDVGDFFTGTYNYRARVLRVFKGCATPASGPSRTKLFIMSYKASSLCGVRLTVGEKYVLGLSYTAQVVRKPSKPLVLGFQINAFSYIQLFSSLKTSDLRYLRAQSKKPKNMCMATSSGP